MNAYTNRILSRRWDNPEHAAAKNLYPFVLACDYVDTVNESMEAFLKSKTNKTTFNLENTREDFPVFWTAIGASGNLAPALEEMSIRHNSST
jgi:hypothetical protein